MAQNPYGGYQEQPQPGYQQQPQQPWPQPPHGGGGGGGLARVILGVLILVAAIGAGGFFYLQARNAELQLVNALGIPVEITIGDQSATVDPHSWQEISVAPGSYTITVANEAGETIAEEDVEVPGFTDVVSYNVLGAADLYAEGVVYQTVVTGTGDNPYEVFIGETYVTRDDVDYVMEEAPDSVSVSGSQSTDTRWMFYFVDPADWGWQASIDVLIGLERTADATTLAQNIDQWDTNAGAQNYLSSILGGAAWPEEFGTDGDK